MQQRLTGYQQRQSQHQQSRKGRAAPSEDFDSAEEDPQVEHQQRDGQHDAVFLDEEGVGVVAFGVDHEQSGKFRHICEW